MKIIVRKKSSKKANKPKSRPKTRTKMASRKKSRKSSSRRKKSFADSLPVVNSPAFKKAAAGVGTATLGVTILGLVAPSIATQPLVRPALAFAGGGIEGAVAQLLAGGGINLFGGNGSSGGGAA